MQKTRNMGMGTGMFMRWCVRRYMLFDLITRVQDNRHQTSFLMATNTNCDINGTSLNIAALCGYEQWCLMCGREHCCLMWLRTLLPRAWL